MIKRKETVDLTKQVPVRSSGSHERARQEFIKKNDEFLEALRKKLPKGVSVRLQRTVVDTVVQDRYFFSNGEIIDLLNNGYEAKMVRKR